MLRVFIDNGELINACKDLDVFQKRTFIIAANCFEDATIEEDDSPDFYAFSKLLGNNPVKTITTNKEVITYYLDCNGKIMKLELSVANDNEVDVEWNIACNEIDKIDPSDLTNFRTMKSLKHHIRKSEIPDMFKNFNDFGDEFLTLDGDLSNITEYLK